MNLGQIKGFYITSGIADLCDTIPDFNEIMIEKLDDFLENDWGETNPDDKEVNKRALETGDRVLAAYTVKNKKIWIIADAKEIDDTRKITILLPEEY